MQRVSDDIIVACGFHLVESMKSEALKGRQTHNNLFSR